MEFVFTYIEEFEYNVIREYEIFNILKSVDIFY